MCHCRLIILLLFTSLTAICIKAQQPFNYPFRHINQSDGLLHARVNSIVQDGKGFIWILTPNGLQRYDGSRFVNYPFDLNNPARITNTSDLYLYADKKNNTLWLMYSEIEKLDLQKNKFTLYTSEKILQDSSFKFDAYKDTAGNPWLAGPLGVFRYDTTEQKTLPYYFAATPLSLNQSHLTFTDTANGDTWLVDWHGLVLFDKKTKQKYTHWYNPILHPLLQLMDKKNLNSIFKDSRQNIWISTGSSSFYKYNCINKKLAVYSLAEIEKLSAKNISQNNTLIVKCFFEDNHHNIWIGTANGGLLQYKLENNLFTYSINEEKNKQGLHYNYEITCIFQDKEENIWLGTDKGINIFNPYRRYFQSIHHDENNAAASLPKNEIMHYIQAANGNILAGTWGGGITVYDSNWNFIKNISFPKPYEYNLVWSFIQNDDGNIWIGCQHGFIHVYNPSNGSINTIHPPELNNQTIWCMTKDRKGNIWMGLNDGKIAEWDKQLNKFYFYNDNTKNTPQSYGNVSNIFFDSRQRCWVSTADGFKQFDTEKRMYAAVYLPDTKNSRAISSGNCEGIEEYDDTTLLIGTLHGGLNYFNPDKKTFSHLTVADGLPANTIHTIKKDAAGFILFSTDYDLYKFKPADKKFIRMNIEPGTVNAPFNYAPFYQLQDGRWLAATATEIICFRPQNDDGKKNADSKVKITGFKIFDRSLFIDSLLDNNKPVQLSYKQNFLTIEFALLNFSNLQQTNYYYQLDGVDKDWVNTGTKGFAGYTNLEPGKYVFTVKAEDGSGGTTTSFKIIITPPFWKTWWFISIIAFSILLLSYLFIRGREKSFKTIAAEKLKVQQLNAEKYKNKFELEQIINYFSSSLTDKNKVDDVLWDVTKNLIGRLGFVDCMIYLWNDDKTKMIQKAGIGPKGSVEEIKKQHFDVLPGQGVVGYVMQTKEPLLIPDTSKDSRYRADEMQRLSEITVPVIYNDELIGVIDSEHPDKNFYTQQHLQILNTIATLMADKIKSVEAEQLLWQSGIKMYSMNEQLLKAKLEALQSQMNPHFIFNSLNSIDNLIQTNQKDKATTYLARFAKLIRNVLDSSKNDVVSFQKDYETLELYLQMEQFRCNEKFTYQLLAEDELLNGDYKVLPLIVQPFVENAIHHGLLNKQNENRRLTVAAIVENDYVKYIVTDNGVGRLKAQQLNEINKPEQQSYGINITKERIQLYNKKEENNDVIITDLFENNQPAGTRVEISIKIFESI
jgi:ligand-binding sensor domain-containing protein/putative methionine-R-sulfoxide reductase with GAF domain/anti-sigma regulatory factor (Ser/Thr protein kinase)